MRTHIFGGPGIRVTQTIHGYVVRADVTATVFEGAFFVELIGQTSAQISPGEISKVPAMIGGVPLEGDKSHAAPTLSFGDKVMLDSTGRGYICAECTFDSSDRGEWALKTVEMVQVADPDTDDGSPGTSINAFGGANMVPGNRARLPVAMLISGAGGLTVRQIEYFDRDHRISFSAATKLPIRCFFF